MAAYTIVHLDDFERPFPKWALARKGLGLTSFGMNVAELSPGETIPDAMSPIRARLCDRCECERPASHRGREDHRSRVPCRNVCNACATRRPWLGIACAGLRVEHM